MITYASRINLKAVKRLPHSDDISCLRISPKMMRPERPMIDFSNSVYILNTKNLPTNVNKLLNPIVLHWVVNLDKKGLQIQFSKILGFL